MKDIRRIIGQELAHEFSNAVPELTPVNTGASSKVFFRMSGELTGRWSQKSLILMWMGGDPPSIFGFLNIHDYLQKNNIRVPEIFFAGRSGNYLILEDCGGDTIETTCRTESRQPEALYRPALDLLLAMQKLKPEPECVACQRYFDTAKFMFEFTFHIKEQLISNYFHHRLSASDAAQLTADYEQIAKCLSSQPMVFTHRDFQSSNILIHNGGLVLADFQDARMGLPFYDLVSLLEDSYVTLSARDKEDGIGYYLSRADSSVIPESVLAQFHQIYDWTTIQRKLHDAGAFAFCYQNLGNNKYLPYIPIAVRQALVPMNRYDVFARTHDLLSSILENEEKF